ncbi:MAG: cache domain-containing protein [Thermodesulfobacteriota bacterium]
MKDIKGNMVYLQLCEAASRPDGGWVEYWWPKHGGKTPERKVAYMLQASGTHYQVGAGIYDVTISIKALEDLLE